MNLPLDIFLNIIARLSIKPLAICRCVCKTWRYIIHHPHFTHMHRIHLIQSELDLKTSILWQLNCSEFGFFEDDGVDVNPENLDESIMGSCRGLLCLWHYSTGDIMVCNPVTGEWMWIDPSRNELGGFVASGFGFDHVANMYKVVLIYDECEAHVYTLGSDQCRCVGEGITSGGESRAFLNGALHWITINKFNIVVIVAFDLSKEEYRVVPDPSGLTLSGESEVRDLGVLGGFLCLLDQSFDDRCEIWVMKDYGVQSSWIREYVISQNLGPFRGAHFKLVALVENGNMMLLVDRKWLVSYDPTTGSFYKLKNDEIVDAVEHVGSFVSLQDVVGRANSKSRVNTGMWYRSSREFL